MFKVQLIKHGKALTHALHMRRVKLLSHALAQTEVACVVAAVAGQDTVREGASHRRAPSDAPIGRAGHGRLFVFVERPREARAGDQREHLALQKTELGDERIGGEQDICGVDRALGAFDPHRRAGLDPAHRRLFANFHIIGHEVAEPAAHGRRVYQYCAWRVDGGVIVTGSHHVGEGIAIEPLIRLATGLESVAQVVEPLFFPAVDDRGQVAPG